MRPSLRTTLFLAPATAWLLCMLVLPLMVVIVFSFGVTPTEPIPCTFECPRIGMSPAPGLPTMPRSSARLPIACTFSTP